ncbi:hypothetical protein E1200_17245 [Actinomadura sp. GC306]|uniref:hypothetical protein n=1 Tax=Actinomadura sp. GC306 TaxID=2530367 RepID=UPI001046D169|nr:hypothetical protein [Actinomadura sp. GC306]TDC66098.1 hypothetical protein E1200_17245 [Actinomadura sp. GC306]
MWINLSAHVRELLRTYLHGEGPIVVRVFADEHDHGVSVEDWDAGDGRLTIGREDHAAVSGRGSCRCPNSLTKQWRNLMDCGTMSAMARFQDTLTLIPVPRSLVDEVVRALLDVLEKASLGSDDLDAGGDGSGNLRLVEGEHLTAGARYQVQKSDDDEPYAELKVVSWNRTGESEVEIRADIEDQVVNARAKLRTAGQRLHTLRVEGDYKGPRPVRMLMRASWEAEGRFEDWWATLGPRTTPPISLRIKHPFALASIAIERGKDADDRWSVNSTVRLRGRWIARPLAAVGLLVMRSRIRRALSKRCERTEAAWNGAVPGMVERGYQERVAVQHQVKVTAVSREWFDEYVAAFQRHVGELRFENGRLADTSADVRLLEGEHIQPGARYRVALDENDEGESHDESEGEEKRTASLDVSVTAWDADGHSRIEFTTSENAQTGWVELNPTLVRLAFDGQHEAVTRLSVTAEGDLERWWAGDGGPAFVARIEQPLGEGTFSVVGSQAEDDHWTMDVSLTAEGRGWGRPAIAIAGLLSGGAIQDEFKATTDEAAADWNDAVSKAIEAGPDQAAKTTLQRLLNNYTAGTKPD